MVLRLVGGDAAVDVAPAAVLRLVGDDAVVGVAPAVVLRLVGGDAGVGVAPAVVGSPGPFLPLWRLSLGPPFQRFTNIGSGY